MGPGQEYNVISLLQPPVGAGWLTTFDPYSRAIPEALAGSSWIAPEHNAKYADSSYTTPPPALE